MVAKINFLPFVLILLFLPKFTSSIQIEYMKISDRAIKMVKGNNKATARLMIAFDRGQKSIEVWMENKDLRLTTPLAVQIISEETGLSHDDILVEEQVAA